MKLDDRNSLLIPALWGDSPDEARHPEPPVPRPGLGRHQGFTLVEVIVVIAIIGIMTSLVVTVYRNVAQDSRDVVARQQQAALQNAVNNWITSETSARAISAVREEFNAAANSDARLAKISAYLDGKTYEHFDSHTTAGSDQVKSAALNKLNKHLELSTWAAASYPQVQMKDNS